MTATARNPWTEHFFRSRLAEEVRATMAQGMVSLQRDGHRPKCKVRGNMGNHRVFEATPPEQPAKNQSEQCIEPDSAQNHNRCQRHERCHRRQMARSERDRGK